MRNQTNLPNNNSHNPCATFSFTWNDTSSAEREFQVERTKTFSMMCIWSVPLHKNVTPVKITGTNGVTMAGFKAQIQFVSIRQERSMRALAGFCNSAWKWAPKAPVIGWRTPSPRDPRNMTHMMILKQDSWSWLLCLVLCSLLLMSITSLEVFSSSHMANPLTYHPRRLNKPLSTSLPFFS